MTLQWTLVALFLYVEIAFLLLLMLPWIRAPKWKQIFNSRLVRAIEQYSTVFYYSIGAILFLLFLDALREVRKYGSEDMSLFEQYQTPHADTMIHMRLFRAQRNLYIAGFALFLYLVCRRMVQMLTLEANLMASNEASLKQAQGASKAAQAMLNEKKEPVKEGSAVVDEGKKRLQATIADMKEELARKTKDREDFMEQANAMKKDYDLLLKEYDKLKKGSGSDKKAD